MCRSCSGYPLQSRRSLVLTWPGKDRGDELALIVRRDRTKRRVEERELWSLAIVQIHFMSMYRLLGRVEWPSPEELAPAEYALGRHHLSRREAQIAALLCKRITNRQVA